MVPRLSASYNLRGLGHCSNGPWDSLDLRDHQALKAYLEDFHPDVAVHGAAYREPDFCEEEPGEARRLNVGSVKHLCKLLPPECPLVFISSDYVFDGQAPPYSESSSVFPVNVYGQTKVEAEAFVLNRPRGIVLRVPVLVGAGETLASSGFISQMREQVLGGIPEDVDDVIVRFPTWTEDVGHCVAWLLEQQEEGLFHFSGLRGGTRYQWTKEVAGLLDAPSDHLMPSQEVIPRKAVRPINSQLLPGRLQALGYKRFTDFQDVVKNVLQRFA